MKLHLAAALAFVVLGCGSPAGRAESDSGDCDGDCEDGGSPDGAAPPPWFTLEKTFDSEAFGPEKPPDLPGDSLTDVKPYRRVGGGVCVLDVDGEAPLDLFFALRDDGANISSRLLVAQSPFDYEDRTVDYGLDAVSDAVGCLAFDADGDGDDDLVITQLAKAQLFLRDGDTFVDAGDKFVVEDEADALFAGASAADLDGDLDLDILVAGYLRTNETGGYGFPGDIHGVADHLMIREDDGSYVDRTSELAPVLDELDPTYVLPAFDITGDGVPEIFVGSDLIGSGFHNYLLERDEDGVYQDASAKLGHVYDWQGTGMDSMGWTSGDIDRDGRPEYAVSNYHDKPTVVFDCDTDGFCEDLSNELHTDVTKSVVRWGLGFADFDLDGWVDLFEATGDLFTAEEQTVVGTSGAGGGNMATVPVVHRNYHNQGFALVATPESDGRHVPAIGRGIALVDLDDDGRMDVVMATASGRPHMLRNVVDPVGHWLRVVLHGKAPNTGAFGAFVTVTSTFGPLAREHVSAEGYLGNFDPRLHFGIEDDEPVTVEVRWPNGETATLEAVDVDQEIIIEE